MAPYKMAHFIKYAPYFKIIQAAMTRRALGEARAASAIRKLSGVQRQGPSRSQNVWCRTASLRGVSQGYDPL